MDENSGMVKPSRRFPIFNAYYLLCRVRTSALERAADVAVEHSTKIIDERIRLALHAAADPFKRQPCERCRVEAREAAMIWLSLTFRPSASLRM